jgi:hypothetical protein
LPGQTNRGRYGGRVHHVRGIVDAILYATAPARTAPDHDARAHDRAPPDLHAGQHSRSVAEPNVVADTGVTSAGQTGEQVEVPITSHPWRGRGGATGRPYGGGAVRHEPHSRAQRAVLAVDQLLGPVVVEPPRRGRLRPRRAPTSRSTTSSPRQSYDRKQTESSRRIGPGCLTLGRRSRRGRQRSAGISTGRVTRSLAR